MPEQTNGSDLFEIIKTTRSMRRLKPDPVPNEMIRKILEAGVCAPSGGNMQRWRFLVIRDDKIKETVGGLYKHAWDEQVAPRYRAGEPAPGRTEAAMSKQAKRKKRRICEMLPRSGVGRDSHGTAPICLSCAAVG